MADVLFESITTDDASQDQEDQEDRKSAPLRQSTVLKI